MKARIILTIYMIVGIMSMSLAQVEYDDMYFNSNDRARLNAQKASETYAYNASKKKKKSDENNETEATNPTDSYSARNVNPEHTSRSNAETAAEDDQDYFVNNYQYNTANQYSNWGNNYNNWYNSSWYNSSWYGPYYSTWNSPYYGGYWGNPYYYDPYYSSWPGSYGYYNNLNSWNSGWGISFSWGNPYYSSFYGPSWGWGSSYYCGNYWNTPGRTIVVVNNNSYENGRNVTYGRRATRDGYSYGNTSGNRTRSVAGSYDGTRSNSGGRVSTSNTSGYTPDRTATNRGSRTTTYTERSTSTNNGTTTRSSGRQEDYYNRSWRNNASHGSSTNNSSNTSRSSGSNYNYNRSSSNYNWNSGGSSSSGSSYSPSRSSGGSSGSGSSGGSSSGGSSGGRTRGR